MNNDAANIDAPTPGESSSELGSTTHAEALIEKIRNGDLSDPDPELRNTLAILHAEIADVLYPIKEGLELSIGKQLETLWMEIFILSQDGKPVPAPEGDQRRKESSVRENTKYHVPLNLPLQGPDQTYPEAELTFDPPSESPTQIFMSLKEPKETRPVFDQSHQLYYAAGIRFNWREATPECEVLYIIEKDSGKPIYSEDGSFDPNVHTIRYHKITKEEADIILPMIQRNK